MIIGIIMFTFGVIGQQVFSAIDAAWYVQLIVKLMTYAGLISMTICWSETKENIKNLENEIENLKTEIRKGNDNNAKLG